MAAFERLAKEQMEIVHSAAAATSVWQRISAVLTDVPKDKLESARAEESSAIMKQLHGAIPREQRLPPGAPQSAMCRVCHVPVGWPPGAATSTIAPPGTSPAEEQHR